ncbi:MAG: septum formation initiator family protein [Bacteroidota bacterium]
MDPEELENTIPEEVSVTPKTSSAPPIFLRVVGMVEKHFFLVFAIFFLVWMFFVDGNDFVNQYRSYQQIKDLEAQKEYYETRIEAIESQRKALQTDPEQLERYARETYRLQRKDEEVFIIE